MQPEIICLISFILYIFMSVLDNCYTEKKYNGSEDLSILLASIFYYLINIAIGIVCIVYFFKWIF